MAIKDLKQNGLYNKLQKNKKNLIKLSALFIVLSLTINAFAWLASHNTAELDAEMDVSSWIVKFTDEEDTEIKNAVYHVRIEPGLDFNKTVTATNDGRVDADITVEIASFTIFGQEIDVVNDANALSKFPFSVNFDKEPLRLSSGQTTTFDASVEWSYEEDKYFKDDPIYEGFHEDYEYFTKSGATYTKVDVTADTYDALKSNLYLYKDDVDTFFGEKCGEYQNNTGNTCLTFGIKYIASQVEPTP